MNYAIETENLTCKAAGREILHGITFSVKRGEFMSIIGPNGAGKSTLLKCIGGLTASCGRISLCGRDMRKLTPRERARMVAWLHQSGTDSLPFTVREFAQMSRYPWRGVLSGESSRDKRIVDAALKRTSADMFADRALSTLSGGERQRALLAAALAQETDIIFLDEPTNFLDYKQQSEMAHLVSKLNSEGLTVVMVTHDINLAISLKSSILAVKAGEVVFRGSYDALPALLPDIFETDFTMVRDNNCLFAFPKGVYQ